MGTFVSAYLSLSYGVSPQNISASSAYVMSTLETFQYKGYRYDFVPSLYTNNECIRNSTSFMWNGHGHDIILTISVTYRQL